MVCLRNIFNDKILENFVCNQTKLLFECLKRNVIIGTTDADKHNFF